MARIILGRATTGARRGDLVTLSPEHLRAHMVLLGSTGSGKSRLIRKMCEDHLNRGWGFAIIDKHGDTAEDVLGVAAKQVVESGTKAVLKRLHYVEMSPFLCPRIDPFHFVSPPHLHPELRDNAYRAWLSAQADLYASVLQSKQGYGDFEGQPRLQRMLRNVLIACGTTVRGQRLPLGSAGILIDLGHPLHQEIYDCIHPHLPREVQADFETLHSFKRMEDVRRESESTLNRLRSFFSPLLSASMSQSGSSLDPASIIQRGHGLLVNLRQTPYFSHDQGVGIGKLFIHNLIHAMETMPREKRRPFTIIVEEAGELISDEIQRALGAVRKYQCRMILCGQDLSTFRKKDLDLVPKLLSQCGVVCSFNQKWPEDCELLARVLYTADLSFKPLEQEVERHGGYDWLKVLETSKSMQLSDNWSSQQGRSRSKSHSEQTSEQHSLQQNWSRGESHQVSDGSGMTHGENQSESLSRGNREQPVLQNAEELRRLSVGSMQRSESRSQQSSESQSHTESAGSNASVGGSRGVSHGTSQGSSSSHGTNESEGVGGSMSIGQSESEKLVHLARIVRERQLTGHLERAISDQLEQYRQRIASLPPRHAILTIQGSQAVEFETVPVPDPFVSAEALVRAVEWVKRELLTIHPYLFVPDLSLTEEERILRAFLARAHGKASVSESSPECASSDEMEEDPFA